MSTEASPDLVHLREREAQLLFAQALDKVADATKELGLITERYWRRLALVVREGLPEEDAEAERLHAAVLEAATALEVAHNGRRLASDLWQLCRNVPDDEEF